MAQEVIAVWGIRVGSVERSDAVRHSFAFDLRDLDFRDRPIVSAAIELPPSVARSAGEVELSDPSDRVAYGCARQIGTATIRYIELSGPALLDLQNASGAFFSVEATFNQELNQPLCLAGAGEQRLTLLAVADARRGSASAPEPLAEFGVSAA